MLLLESIVLFDGARVVCEAKPGADCIFARGAALPAVVLLEYMAQAAAAFRALATRERGVPRVGLLLSARRLRFSCREIALDTPLEVSATLSASDTALGSFECSVRSLREELASGRLTVFTPPEREAFS
jgi:predicted hotdog family 3-hydroxylacyl-ACP dehydratase